MLSVHRKIAKFLTVYRVCYTPTETLKEGIQANFEDKIPASSLARSAWDLPSYYTKLPWLGFKSVASLYNVHS